MQTLVLHEATSTKGRTKLVCSWGRYHRLAGAEPTPVGNCVDRSYCNIHTHTHFLYIPIYRLEYN